MRIGPVPGLEAWGEAHLNSEDLFSSLGKYYPFQ